ncbi:MAG: Rpn family recombination-promoting nuclease/putative transposase [Treponema sp.]|nr:Rpn family recombination-promoting nuclease/putative transposase [Treponema sp.]
MIANREYKSSVFSWLFGTSETLRELYGALSGVELPADIPVTINTLEGVLFKGRMNDISFEIDHRLVIVFEHQSTINENMPLRILLYIARIYETIIAKRSIYREKRVSLPYPEFIVLYNGTAPCGDEYVLNLSDAFTSPGELSLSKGEYLPLELKVKVYNINRGHNEGILRRSKTLEGYSYFIDTIRKYEEAGTGRDDAMKLAVEECIGDGVLKVFLEQHGSEVVNMLMTEWNWDEALEVREEEGLERGLEQGRMEGQREGRMEGQNVVLELVRRGYSAEQIEAKLAAGETIGNEMAGK